MHNVNTIVNGQYRTFNFTDSTCTHVCSVSIFKDHEWSILHNEHGPAHITYHDNNVISSESYFINGKYHRDGDLPARIMYHEDGSKHYEFWYRDGKEHRDHGPSYIFYYKGNISTMSWSKDGAAHNEHGPAYIANADTKKPRRYYFINGKRIPKLRFLKQYKPTEYEDHMKNKTYRINYKKYKITFMNDDRIIMEKV